MFPASLLNVSWILRVDPRQRSVIDPITSPTGMEAIQIYQIDLDKDLGGCQCGTAKSWVQQNNLLSSAFSGLKTGPSISGQKYLDTGEYFSCVPNLLKIWVIVTVEAPCRTCQTMLDCCSQYWRHVRKTGSDSHHLLD